MHTRHSHDKVGRGRVDARGIRRRRGLLVLCVRIALTRDIEQEVPAVAATALVQTRIDPALKERATAILDNMGLTVSDAVRILLMRIANEGRCRSPALEDPRPAASHDDVEAYFAKRRTAVLRKGRE
jgi:DNA-damage-inducible protein J